MRRPWTGDSPWPESAQVKRAKLRYVLNARNNDIFRITLDRRWPPWICSRQAIASFPTAACPLPRTRDFGRP
jgi:hypothetical protein